jgi:SAM-dependent methyltransferase
MEVDQMSISYFLQRFAAYGVRHTVGSVLQAKLGLRIREFGRVRRLIEGKKGLEIGGPSSSFEAGGVLPIYNAVGTLDNCSYAPSTLWAQHEPVFRFSDQRPPGAYFVSEATELAGIPDASYDFVLASHVIEHTANPLKALGAWRRVLRPGGILVLLVPDKERTFDNTRATTTFDHVLADFVADVGEDDRTHVEEMLANHNFNRTPDWSLERLREMVEANTRTRGLHHHVFDLDLVRQMLRHANLELVFARRSLPNHLVAVAAKPHS